MRHNITYQGLVTGLLAYSIWGFFPLFFHLLRSVPAFDVLMHRIIWSFVFVFIIIIVLKRKHLFIKAIKSPNVIKNLLLSALLVSSNWLIFIWAVAENRVVETSLGYFITPLVSVFLARTFLGEILNKWQKLAIILASLGLGWLVLRIGYLPWISLSLAITFGWYGLVRKQVDVDTLTGLAVETTLLMPVATCYWLFMLVNGEAVYLFPENNQIMTLLILSGIVTAMPLLLFASAAKKLSLSAIGFMMYINPTIQFVSALYILDEPFDINQLIGFSFIWCALIVFSIGSLQASRIKDREALII